MNLAISKFVESRKLLTMIASLLAGILVASAVVGQEANLDVAAAGSDSVETTEVETPTIQQAEFGQLVTTSKKCGVEPVCVLPQDDIWLICARDSHRNPCDLSMLRCSRLHCGQWVDAQLDDLTQLHATDKSKVTMIYIHGNRTNLKWAKSRGLQFYESSLQTVNRPPIRFVIFAWKSEAEVPRVLPDFRIKSARSVCLGKTFGQLLGKFDDRHMLLGGFSLGAQVILTAVTSPELHDDRPGRYQVAIFAPSLNPSFVQSGLLAYRNNSIVEETNVFLNKEDRAVKFSQLVARKRTNTSISTLAQLARSSECSSNVIQIHDITCEISKQHSIVKYGLSPLLNRKLAESLNATFAHSTTEGETMIPPTPQN
jgi:hypothetical protein